MVTCKWISPQIHICFFCSYTKVLRIHILPSTSLSLSLSHTHTHPELRCMSQDCVYVRMSFVGSKGKYI